MESTILNKTQKGNIDHCNPIDRCPVITTLEVIGGKWKPAILWEMTRNGTMRFGQLKKAIEGITQKMLTQQLRELESDNIIDRKVYAEVPPRVEYSLTEYGQSITPVLNEMANWGLKHLNKNNTRNS